MASQRKTISRYDGTHKSRNSAADREQREVVKHIETTLARSLFNCDELYAKSNGTPGLS
jgi:hypothetical protein